MAIDLTAMTIRNNFYLLGCDVMCERENRYIVWKVFKYTKKNTIFRLHIKPMKLRAFRKLRLHGRDNFMYVTYRSVYKIICYLSLMIRLHICI